MDRLVFPALARHESREPIIGLFARSAECRDAGAAGRDSQAPDGKGKPQAIIRRACDIADHHTDGVEAGRVLQRVQPKLAVFSHSPVMSAATLALVRQNYAGPVEFGEDLMTIEVGETVSVHRFVQPKR